MVSPMHRVSVSPLIQSPINLGILISLHVALLSFVETLLAMIYVYLAHVSNWPGAPLIGFTSAIMTLSKTILYWLQEYYCGGCSVGHNTWGNLILYWLFPNGYVFLSPLNPCLLRVLMTLVLFFPFSDFSSRLLTWCAVVRSVY